MLQSVHSPVPALMVKFVGPVVEKVPPKLPPPLTKLVPPRWTAPEPSPLAIVPPSVFAKPDPEITELPPFEIYLVPTPVIVGTLLSISRGPPSALEFPAKSVTITVGDEFSAVLEVPISISM